MPFTTIPAWNQQVVTLDGVWDDRIYAGPDDLYGIPTYACSCRWAHCRLYVRQLRPHGMSPGEQGVAAPFLERSKGECNGGDR
jgi:hypothetical protein